MISLIKYAGIGIAFYVIFSGMFTVNYRDNGEVALIFNGMRDGYWTASCPTTLRTSSSARPSA